MPADSTTLSASSCESHVSLTSNSSTGKKITITDVLQNKLASPHCLKDFEVFLKKQHTEEMLEFLLSLKKFREKVFGMGTPFPPVGSASSPTTPSSTVAPSLNGSILSISTTGSATGSNNHVIIPTAGSLRMDTLKMMEIYFANGAEKELPISQPTRKKLCAELGEGKTHPDVFQKAVDEVIDILRGNWLSKFLESGKK